MTLIKKEVVKQGRRTYGIIYELSDGREVYLAHRRTKEIFRMGEKSISDAIRAKKACWAVDYATLLKMRARQVKFIGILDKDTGDIWLTSTAAFMDKTKASIKNYERRGGSLQQYLPLQYFVRRSGRKTKI
jgi:hypothetical protein